MARQAGEASVLVWKHVHWQTEQRYVVVHCIGVVPRVRHCQVHLEPTEHECNHEVKFPPYYKGKKIDIVTSYIIPAVWWTFYVELHL